MILWKRLFWILVVLFGFSGFRCKNGWLCDGMIVKFGHKVLLNICCRSTASVVFCVCMVSGCARWLLMLSSRNGM